MNPQNDRTSGPNPLVDKFKIWVENITNALFDSRPSRFIARMASVGITSGMDLEQRADIIIINVLSWTTAIISVIGPAILFWLVRPELMVLLPGLLESMICLVVIYLNHKGKYRVAGKGFFILQCLAVLYFGVCFDPAAGVQQMVFFMGGLSLLIFKDTLTRLCCSVLILLMLYALEYNYDHNLFRMAGNRLSAISVRQVVYPAILVLNFLILFLYEFSKSLRKRQSRKTERILRMYTVKLTHDSRNSLHRLQNLVDAYKPGKGNIAHVPTYILDIMQENVKELQLLYNNLLSYEHLHKDENEKINYQPVPLKSILENAADAFTVYGNKKNVRVRLELHEDLPAGIVSDPDKLIRILNNLLSHALKSAPPRTIITLKAMRGLGNTLMLFLSDQGPGIPEDQFESTFEPNTLQADKEGNGIGLVIARYYARALGGDLTLQESFFSYGTTFRLSIPVKEAVIGAQKAERKRTASPDLLVMAVDDHEKTTFAVNILLSNFRSNVIVTSNAKSAMARIEHCNPDVILLDLVTPEIDGLQLLGSIRQNRMTRHIPVIIATGKKDLVFQDEAIDMLYLPFDPDDLLSMVNKIKQQKSA